MNTVAVAVFELTSVMKVIMVVKATIIQKGGVDDRTFSSFEPINLAKPESCN